MKSYLFDSLRNFAFSRCRHTSPSGRRCRQPVCPSDPSYCFAHVPKPDADASLDAQLTAELAAAAAHLDTAENIYALISKIILAATQNRIELRRARFLIAACNALLRCQRLIALNKKLQADGPQEFVEFIDLPRPDWPDPDDPPPTNPSPSHDAARANQPSASPAQPAASTREPASVSASLSAHDPSPRSERSSDVSLASPTQAKTVAVAAAVPVPSPSPATPTSGATGSPTKPTPPEPPPKPRPHDFFNHFYPITPSLPPGSQDLEKSVPLDLRRTGPPHLRRYARYSSAYYSRRDSSK